MGSSYIGPNIVHFEFFDHSSTYEKLISLKCLFMGNGGFASSINSRTPTDMTQNIWILGYHDGH